MKYHLTSFMVLLTITLLLAKVGYAADWRDKIFIHGFGGWMYGQTDNDNVHFLGGWESEGNADYFNFSLNVRADLSENLTVYFQPAFEEISGNREATVDYVFAEWFLSNLFAIRGGKIKAPLMLMNEVHDVGTVRPFLLHPVGVYSDATAENFQGIGLTGVYFPDFESDWLFSYDIYAGFTDIDEKIEKKREGSGTTTEVTRWTIDEMLGARFFIHPPVEGLRFGVSAYTGKQEYSFTTRGNIEREDEGKAHVVGGSIEYLSPQWELRSEYLKMTKDSAKYNENHELSSLYEEQRDTFYFEAAYRLTDHWQIATRYEMLDYPDYPDSQDNEPDPPSFKESEEISFGLNYWIQPTLVLKSSLTYIQGNLNAIPGADAHYSETEDPKDLEEETILGMFGVQ
ncbi:MAG: hypothetical protein D3924_08205, partial [Candidatus Electrothrix sp. AR4]|nr:hypothetical protein [Candidatus Electrothrix sp. AR4]